MNRDYFVELYDYSCWANERVWDCVRQLSDDDYRRTLTYPESTIEEQCQHTMSVEHWWLTFLDTGTLDFPDLEQLTTREALRAQWDRTAAMVRAYLARLTGEEVQRMVHPPFWDEAKPAVSVAQAITQVVIHSTDHRAQILAGLHSLGAPTVEQDVLGFLFARPR